MFCCMKSALIQAAIKGHQSVVEVLLAAGADINKQDKNGRSALDGSATGAERSRNGCPRNNPECKDKRRYARVEEVESQR